MIRSYFKFAWRNLLRDKQFSLLNLLGLSAGLACALMIFVWVNDELSIDTFNEKDKQLYQVMKTSVGADGRIDTYESTPALLAQMIVKEMPEVEYATAAFKSDGKGVVSFADRHFKAQAQFADTNYFRVFSYRLLQGNKSKILTGQNEVLVSDKLALKLFNTTENIIGKTIAWDHYEKELNGPYTVAGVFEAPLSNATVQFDVLFSYERYFDIFKQKYGLANWGSNSTVTYVIVKRGTDVAQFNNKIRDYSRAKYKAQHGTNGLEWEGRIFLQRYSERYLYNRYENDGVQSAGRMEYVRLFSIIAIFIVVIACINFMNLSTAKASRRMKEIGIKKVVGAGRGTLILQYIGESVLMAFLSLLVAIVTILILFPAFKEITGKQIDLHFSGNIIFSVLLITLLTGLMAGSYPAFYLSGFKPITVLKGTLAVSGSESWLRKGLVVFQFTISVVLIISVLVIYKQTRYIHSKNLGYNKDNVIRFANDGKIRNHLPSFLTELKKIPGVVNASSMSGDMMGNQGGGGGLNWPGKPEGKGVEFDGVSVDHDLMSIFELKMAGGRSFSRQFGDEKENVIFNEAAIAAMNLKNPVGQVVEMWGVKREIIGIAKDFHFKSLYNKVGPFFFTFSPENDDVIVKISAGKEKETLAGIEKFYKQYNLGLPFTYSFIDDDYQALYSSEQRLAVLSRYFAGIAILISCLGLFGLAAFTAQKRQKEIGIRKIVGATVKNIAFMLSKDFLKLVFVAVLVAFPLSYWMMDQWLRGYAYRVSIGINVFIIAGISVVLITILTISFQAIKAAVANPVKNLRTE